MCGYSIKYTEILEELRRDIAESDHGAAGAANTLLQENAAGLLVLADEVRRSPHQQATRVRLVTSLDHVREAGVTRGFLAFLMSQLHFEREMPNEALRWNEQAATLINGDLPPLARTAVLSQRVGILTQKYSLADAKRAKEAVGELQRPLSSHERRLVLAPQEQLDVSLKFEAGEPIESVRRHLGRHSVFGRSFRRLWAGRLYAQAALHTRAQKEYAVALRLAGDDPVMRAEVDLYRARSLYQTNRHEEALAIFKRVRALFKEHLLHGLHLSAEMGIAHIRRVVGDYDEARSMFEAAAATARELGLRKASYRAALALAQICIDEGRLGDAHKLLDQAASFLDETLNRKELCTLFRWERELAFREDRPQDGHDLLNKAMVTLPHMAKGEGALMIASSVFVEAWYHVRHGEVEQAERKLDQALKTLQDDVICDKQSPYGAEPNARFVESKLHRMKAYLALRTARGREALESTALAVTALGANPSPRVVWRIRFLEGWVHALQRDAERAIAVLKEVTEGGREAGVEDPIRQYIYEYSTLDDPAVVSELAFTAYERMRQSSEAGDFQAFESSVAANILAGSEFALLEPVTPASEYDKHSFESVAAEFGKRMEEYADTWEIIRREYRT